jgi:peptidoglycan/xylan/chitin deacetylase (PgdA/CDA1 family)
MQIDRLTTLRVARPLLQTGLMAAAPGIPILMYHSVSESVEDGVAPYYRVTTSPARFARQLEWLREWGYTVVPLDEAIGGLAAGKLGRERCVVLTFDDGFRDFLTGAWPAIQRMAATATVFLPTSPPNSSSGASRKNAARSISRFPSSRTSSPSAPTPCGRTAAAGSSSRC